MKKCTQGVHERSQDSKRHPHLNQPGHHPTKKRQFKTYNWISANSHTVPFQKALLEYQQGIKVDCSGKCEWFIVIEEMMWDPNPLEDTTEAVKNFPNDISYQ